MSRPLISIIVPCYNQAEYLDECLQSVLDQTYQNWECIIVNDGSPDNTENQIGLAVSQDVFDKEVTKTFITSYKNHLKSLWASYRKVGAIKWDRLI